MVWHVHIPWMPAPTWGFPPLIFFTFFSFFFIRYDPGMGPAVRTHAQMPPLLLDTLPSSAGGNSVTETGHFLGLFGYDLAALSRHSWRRSTSRLR